MTIFVRESENEYACVRVCVGETVREDDEKGKQVPGASSLSPLTSLFRQA